MLINNERRPPYESLVNYGAGLWRIQKYKSTKMEDPNSNPYASPNAALIAVGPDTPALASFGVRLGGAFIDGTIAIVLLFPLLFAIGYLNWEDMKAGIQPDLITKLKTAAVGFISFLLIQGAFLNASGQTIGKKILGMRIVTLDNQKPDFFKLILLRYITVRLISLIPIAGPVFGLANCIFVFIGNERRCLHDRFAGTKVILAK